MDKPAFRQDLNSITRTDAFGRSQYLIEDPASGEVITLNEEEYFLCRQLDGQSALPDVLSRFEDRFGLRLEPRQLDAFVNQLARRGLLAGSAAVSPSAWEPFFFWTPEKWKRWKLFNPERLTLLLSRKLWWIYTRPFAIASCALFLCALGAVAFNFGSFVQEVRLLVAPLTILQMFIIMYVFVNFPAELSRGMTASHFGSRSEEFGVWLVFDILPKFYCISRHWELSRQSHRTWYFFAPSYYAVVIGSVSVLIWQTTTSSHGIHTFSLALAAICILDTLIRFNFLWPVEAYYMLSNWLGIRNFRKRALDIATAWVLRRPRPEALSGGERILFLLYGIATTLATVLVIVTTIYFIGKNLIAWLAGIGGLFFIGLLAIKYRRGIAAYLKENTMFQRISSISIVPRKNKRVRMVFWVVSLAVILLFPYPYEAGGPFKLMPLERIELHTIVPGEIKTVLVRENSLVKRGELQATVDDREHRKNLEVAHAGRDKARQDLTLLEKGPKPEEIKKAQEQVATAKTQSEYSRKEEKRLKALYKEGVVSQEEYQNAANKADVDENALNVAKANLNLVKSGARREEIESQKAIVRDFEAKVANYSEKLQQTALRAPMDGRVVTPYLEMKVGQFMKEGDLFAVYEAAGEIQAEIQIPEADIGEVEIGNKVRIRPMAYPTRFFYGTVTLIAPQATETPNGKVVRVLTRIKNDSHELKPEMTGEAKIGGGWKPVVVAFTRAIVRFVMVEMWSWLP